MRIFPSSTARALFIGSAFLAGVCLPASAASLRGRVQTGGTSSCQPLPGITVTLFEATASTPLATAVTNSSGRFVIASPKENSSSLFYLRAEIGPWVEFVTILGPDLPATATINELTTVAAGYSMAQFYRTGVIAGDAFALRLAAGMNDNLVAVATGESSQVMLTSPNADETNSLRTTRSLANLLAACVCDEKVALGFFQLTKPARGLAPRTTAQAVASLARNPGENIEKIFALSKLRNDYAPALRTAPAGWVVAVKVNDTGDDEHLFGGPGNLAFDDRGYAWVTNNVIQGQLPSTTYEAVLQPNGRPSDGSNGTPLSPITGGGVLGVGFGVTIDGQGNGWFGNFGWGGLLPAAGGVSEFSPAGVPLSPEPNGFVRGIYRAQGLATDARGNIWITSFGNDSVHVFLGGSPDRTAAFTEYHGAQPFDVAITPNGTAWVSNSGGLLGGYPSSVARFALVNGQLQQRALRFVGKSLKGVASDSRGNGWVASLDDNSIYGFRPDGTLIGQFSGGGIDGPWDVAVDGEDNLWVANFGPTKLGSNFAHGRISKLCGVNQATRPPESNVGDPISPASGYRVRSAGSPVLLHNGDPLYGKGAPPSFAPMMRQTAAVIDRAGNIWTANNYKPNFTVDARRNPGGDGLIIFVGLAPPPASRN